MSEPPAPVTEPVTTIPDTTGLDTLDGQPLVTVRILRAPVRLWERAAIHTTGLIREFTLLTLGQAQAGHHDAHAVPHRLIEVADALTARYAGITEAQTQELEEALAAGAPCRDFTYRVPAGVAEACRQLRDLLDEADDYCQRGDLITMVSPADQREFRHWYLEEFIRQVDGRPPTPWPGALD